MNKIERVLAAFHGQETDHVPVSMWKHVPPEYRTDDDRFTAYQRAFYQNTDVDFMKLSADGYFGWPSPVLAAAETADDLYGIRPLGENHPFIRGQIKRTRKVVEALEGDCLSLYLVFAPISYIRLQLGYPKFMKLIRMNPDAFRFAADVVAGDVKCLAEGLVREAGVDGIFYSVQSGEVDRFTYTEYRNWITPSDKAVLDKINALGDLNAIHFCAWEGVRNRLSVWHDYRASVVSWSKYIDTMSVPEARDHFKATVWGGFDNRPGSLLYTGSREEVERETEALIAEGGKRGFILGADCSLHDELAEERIRWVAEAARRI